MTEISEAQAGGIPGSTTADHLIALKQIIRELRKKGKTAYLIFLDVQKAYNKAWLDAILYAMHKNGVTGKSLHMIRKLNSNLTARIHTRFGATREIKIRDSIRQGGILSVIEYATLIDEIAKELKTQGQGLIIENGRKMLWMDDVCLIHHDTKELQQILNTTNHVAKKYHIEFGAAKCKVVKIGKGPKSNILLNNQVLEEVETYKYLGEVFNNKGNMEAHIKAIEGKIHAATQNTIIETVNKEFKGIKMQAIRQMVEATIIPILIYGAEGWSLTQKEERQIQSAFNKALKNHPGPANGNTKQYLLAETGFLPIKYLVNKKKNHASTWTGKQGWDPGEETHKRNQQHLEKGNTGNNEPI